MTARTKFRGSFTALVTPFKNGGLDEKELAGAQGGPARAPAPRAAN